MREQSSQISGGGLTHSETLQLSHSVVDGTANAGGAAGKLAALALARWFIGRLSEESLMSLGWARAGISFRSGREGLELSGTILDRHERRR
jgi:hypothetical protein